MDRGTSTVDVEDAQLFAWEFVPSLFLFWVGFGIAWQRLAPAYVHAYRNATTRGRATWDRRMISAFFATVVSGFVVYELERDKKVSFSKLAGSTQASSLVLCIPFSFYLWDVMMLVARFRQFRNVPTIVQRVLWLVGFFFALSKERMHFFCLLCVLTDVCAVPIALRFLVLRFKRKLSLLFIAAELLMWSSVVAARMLLPAFVWWKWWRSFVHHDAPRSVAWPLGAGLVLTFVSSVLWASFTMGGAPGDLKVPRKPDLDLLNEQKGHKRRRVVKRMAAPRVRLVEEDADDEQADTSKTK